LSYVILASYLTHTENQLAITIMDEYLAYYKNSIL